MIPYAPARSARSGLQPAPVTATFTKAAGPPERSEEERISAEMRTLRLCLVGAIRPRLALGALLSSSSRFFFRSEVLEGRIAYSSSIFQKDHSKFLEETEH